MSCPSDLGTSKSKFASGFVAKKQKSEESIGYFAADSSVRLFEDFLGAEEIGYAVEPCVAAGAGRGLVLEAVVAQAECVQLALNAHAAHLFPNLRYSLIRFAGVGLTKF